jgi:hypothetical protein
MLPVKIFEETMCRRQYLFDEDEWERARWRRCSLLPYYHILMNYSLLYNLLQADLSPNIYNLKKFYAIDSTSDRMGQARGTLNTSFMWLFGSRAKDVLTVCMTFTLMYHRRTKPGRGCVADMWPSYGWHTYLTGSV